MKRPDPALFAAARERFEALAELEPSARAAALAALTESDPELASAVADLLAADEAAGDSFLSQGVGRFAPQIVGEALEASDDGANGGSAAAPGDRIGAYRLRALLGRGGMGEVWEAERADGQFEQTVALKLLKRGMDSEAVLTRFRRERQILARLEHPGIARLLDGGLAPDGRPYFVLERVEGSPITDWCREHASPVAERLRLLIAVAEPVAAAHRSLVVHRDLKPSNILVDASGQVKLLDFGIAKLLASDGDDADRTLLEDRALTPSYAAPEQIRGEAVTTATDVYALGVVLYELLTGRLPHDRTTASSAALAEQVERETLTRPSRAVLENEHASWAQALAGDLDTITLKALARDPARRYESVTALADDLRRHLEGRPVRARPDSRLYRTRKFVGRHRLAVLGTVAAALALLIVAIVARVQAQRAERSAAAATAAAERAERVRGFLVSVFDAADPARTQGEKIEARSLVDEGVRRADAELAADPELRAEMDDVFAGLYRKLGELKPARGLAERSLEARVKRLGAESAEAAKSEWTLGWVLSSQGEFKPAKAHLEHAIAVLDRVEGPESLAAADAREPLMELAFGAEGASAALAVVERRLATYRAVLGEQNDRTALSYSDLGVVLNEVGRHEEAEAAYRKSAAILDALLPENDPRRAYPHSNLAGFLREAKKLEEAVAEAKIALAIRRKSLGDRHPETGMTLGQLTRALLALGRLDEAEAAAREALAILEGHDRFSAMQARSNVGTVLLAKGQAGEALALFDQVIAEHAAVLPPEHVLTYVAHVNRIKALEALGRRSEAIAAARPLLARLEAKGADYENPRSALKMILGRLESGG